jgi:hypothetical protein
MHRRQPQHEDRDPQIIPEVALPIGVVDRVQDEILVLIDMTDVLHQPTVRTSMDAPSVFVMIIGL